jgi:lantibiotic modifying enzyme
MLSTAQASTDSLLDPGVDMNGRLRELFQRWVSQVPKVGQARTSSVAHGAGLYATFLSQAAKVLNDPGLVPMAIGHLAHGAELLNTEPLSTSLYKSVPGYAWALNTLAMEHEINWAEALLTDIDDLLIESFQAEEASPNVDLINGIAGLMVYAISRSKVSSDRRLLSVLASSMTSRYEYWFQGYDVRSSQQRPKCDQDLGIAHGIAGVLSVFSVAARKQLIADDSVELIRAGYDYLWGSSIPCSSGAAYFPHFNGKLQPGRVAWCYGNMGVIAAYLQGIWLDPENGERANRLLDYSLTQYREGNHQIRDASLCHGNAGTALLFSSFSKSAKLRQELRVACRQASRAALIETLASEADQDGRMYFPYLSAKFGYVDSGTLLEGWAGVCLGAAAAVSDTSPAWTELLLLSDAA